MAASAAPRVREQAREGLPPGRIVFYSTGRQHFFAKHSSDFKIIHNNYKITKCQVNKKLLRMTLLVLSAIRRAR